MGEKDRGYKGEERGCLDLFFKAILHLTIT